ncbi:UNVERIFIED_CONTAM: hypothetical protein FKN15_034621, partial [Acipenser sinensis]
RKMKRLQGVCFALCFGYVQNTLALFCPSGQFALKHQCVGCHPTCWECNGHELFECTKCGVDEDGQERFFHRGRCRLHCPRGFYPEQDRFTCEPCMVNCELCADAKVCAKCTGNYKLQSGVCQTTECKEGPDRYFNGCVTVTGQVEDPETGECIDCETGCETCSAGDPELCKSCMEGYFFPQRALCVRGPLANNGKRNHREYQLSDGSCVKQCPDGTYGEPNSWRCESCHGSCQTCHGSLPKNCDSCPHGNLPVYGQCPTVSCVEGQYMDAADTKCYSCDVSCKTCFGPQALDCSSCCTGYFLDQEGACVEHCPVGYFINPATQLCEECSANCESCEGAPEKCLSCKKGPFSLFLHQGNCWSDCPEGYFESAEGTCEACDSLCLSCDENKSNCMLCAAGLYLENGRCSPNCSVKYYPDVDGTCRRCPAHCHTCTDGKTCKACSYLYLLLNGVCKATCPKGYFEDLDQGKCIPCHSTCASCSGTQHDDCDSCSSLFPRLYEGQCSVECPAGTYYESSANECQECDRTCTGCTGPELTDCTKCKKGLALDPDTMMCGVTGDSNCPPKTFLHDDQFTCMACHKQCESCNGPNANDCQTCVLPNYLYNYTPQGCLTCDWGSTLQNGICYPRCEEQRYLSEDEVCKLCDSSCRHCSGPGPNQCVSCKPNFALHPTEKRCIECCESEVNQTDCCLCTTNSGYFLDQEGACVEHCPVGYFINPATQLCEECSANCESCEGAPEKCLSCKKGPFSLFLHQGNCWSNCPEGYFESAEGTCEACDSLCLSCDENTSNCMSCAAGLYLQNGHCSPNCSVNYYPDVDGTCRRCPAHCHTCTDGKTCKACSYLYLLLNGVCKATCPKGYFEDLDQGKCIPCHSTCASCSGTQHDDCDSCSSLYPRLYEGQCSVECPAGTYYESSANECQECDRTCAGCTGPELTDCTKCKKGLALDPDTMMCGVTGDSNCPPKTFLHDDQFTCMACHKQCESCNGPNANDCQTCALPNYLYNGTCLRVCSAGTFESSEEADGVELGFCSACDHVCATCTGASPKDCTTCSSGYFKFMHLCILHCPAGYYRGTTRCEKCDPSCRLCSGPGPQACLSCPPHMLQLDGTRQCVEHCPERFYQDNYKCKQCHTSCKTCKDYTPQGCLTCDWGSTLQNGICYPRCEEQRYLSEDEVCKLCDSSCRHCSGPGPNQCVSCKPNFALHPTEKRCIECCESEVNQTDCCLCTTNSALCIERPHPEPERRLMSENMNSLAISHVSATVPVLVMLVLVITLAVLGLYRARARKKLCWKWSYERLSGSADPNASYRCDMLHGVPDPDDSADEADVVYTSRDGTVYRRYNFIKAQDEEAEGHEDQAAYLNKARC